MPVKVQPDPEERKKALLKKQRRQRRLKEKIENERQKKVGLRRSGFSRRKGGQQVVPKSAMDVLIAKSMAVPSKTQCTFSMTDIRRNYLHNKSFQAVMNTGDYFYFDNYLVLMTKDAFSVKDGKLSLNMELPDFEKKYCVQCVEERISHTVNAQAHSDSGHVANVPLKGWIIAQKFVHATEHAMITGKIKSEFTDFLMIIQGTGYGGDPPFDTFGTTLSSHIERRNLTNEKLCELTEISVRTIQRYRNDEVEPNMPYIIALCIALRLLPCYSEKMIHVAGKVLGENKRDLAYLFLLNTEYINGDVARCNEILEKLGLDRLTKKCN